MAVAALSGDYVNAVQEITSLYGSNNIGVITPRAVLQTIQRFQGAKCSFTLYIAIHSATYRCCWNYYQSLCIC